jgi:hypothetical protein
MSTPTYHDEKHVDEKQVPNYNDEEVPVAYDRRTSVDIINGLVQEGKS